MEKRRLKRGNKILTAVFFLLILVFANVLIYLRDKGEQIEYILEPHFFSDLVDNLIVGDTISIVFLIQVFLIFIIGIMLFVGLFSKKSKKNKSERVLKNKPKNKKKQKLRVKKEKGETDLDAFNRLLKEKKQLKVKDLAEAFKVDKYKIIEWGKILEENNLAVIEYPTFSGPYIKAKSKPKENE